MQLQVGVKVLLKNSEGKYLLARRNPKKYPEVGPKWDIVGGRIEPGTPLLENLRREIKEEVGLNYLGEPKLVAAQDIFVHRHTDTDNAADTDSMEESLIALEKRVVRLTYVGELEGESKVDEDHLEAGWFSGAEISAMPDTQLDSYFKELIEKKIIVL